MRSSSLMCTTLAKAVRNQCSVIRESSANRHQRHRGWDQAVAYREQPGQESASSERAAGGKGREGIRIQKNRINRESLPTAQPPALCCLETSELRVGTTILGSLDPGGGRQPGLTNVMLLQQFVQAREVLNDQVAQDPLVSLDTQQGGAEVGSRQQVLNNGTHHPEGVLLLQEQQEAGGHLARGGHRASTQVLM